MSSDTSPEIARGMAFPTHASNDKRGVQADVPVVVSQVVINMSVGSLLIETWLDGAVSVNGDRVEQVNASKTPSGVP